MISVWSCEHDEVAFDLFEVIDLAMFPTLLSGTLHAPDSHVHLSFFHDIMCTRVGGVSIILPEESILEDVELFADLFSCIGLGV